MVDLNAVNLVCKEAFPTCRPRMSDENLLSHLYCIEDGEDRQHKDVQLRLTALCLLYHMHI